MGRMHSPPHPGETIKEDMLLTVKQAAEFLQVSPDTIYRLLARKEIPAAKIGGSYRFVEEDLIEWVRSKYSDKSNPAKEDSACPTNDQARRTGGSVSAEYDRLLGLPTSRRQKRLKQN